MQASIAAVELSKALKIGIGSLEMARLEAIRKDLEDSSAINALKATGSDTFQNSVASQNLPSFVGVLGRNAALSYLYQKTGALGKLNAQLVDVSLNPTAGWGGDADTPRSQFNYGLGAYDIGTFFGLAPTR
jgi:hypothetical protein